MGHVEQKEQERKGQLLLARIQIGEEELAELSGYGPDFKSGLYSGHAQYYHNDKCFNTVNMTYTTVTYTYP